MRMSRQQGQLTFVPRTPKPLKFHSPTNKKTVDFLTLSDPAHKNIVSPRQQNLNPNHKSSLQVQLNLQPHFFRSIGTKSCAQLNVRPQSQLAAPNQQDLKANPKEIVKTETSKMPYFLSSKSKLQDKMGKNRSENQNKQAGQFPEAAIFARPRQNNSPVFGRTSQKVIHIPKINFSSRTSDSSVRQQSPPYALSDMEMSSGSNGKSQKSDKKATENVLFVPRQDRPKSQSLQKSIKKTTNKVPSFIRLKQLENEETRRWDTYPRNTNEPTQEEQCSGFQIKISIKPAVKKRSFSDFQVIRQLGTGSFGKACLAIQKRLGFICVIKIIQKNMVDEYSIKTLMRQIKIQSFLSHFHTTSLYGFFDDEERVYLILELLPTGNLKAQSKGKALPQARVTSIVFQVLCALDYMHSNSVIHRDIKPQNIFTFDNYIRLGDFGCAVHCETMRNSFVGSPCYLSPQQLRNQDYDDKVDVWQIGVLTYQLLYKVSPFQRDILAIIQGTQSTQLSQLEFPNSPQVSDSAKDFMRKTLNKNAPTRLSIRTALSHPFFKVQREQYESLTTAHF